MGFADAFFKPGWMNRDYFKAKEALEKLSAANNQDKLIHAALNAPREEIRAMAVKRVTDQAVIAKVALEDNAEHTRTAAVKILEDPSIIAQIALNDKQRSVRHMAAEKVTDLASLVKIALQEDPGNIPTLVLYKIAEQIKRDKNNLLDMAKDTDSAIFTKMISRLEWDRSFIDDYREEILDSFIDAGVFTVFDINACDDDGNSLLHFAARGCFLKVCEKFITLGADKNITNNAGLTPLEFAGEDLLIKLLLYNGKVNLIALMEDLFRSSVLKGGRVIPGSVTAALPVKDKTAFKACMDALNLPESKLIREETSGYKYPRRGRFYAVEPQAVTKYFNNLLQSAVPENIKSNILHLCARKEDIHTEESYSSTCAGDRNVYDNSYAALREQAEKLLLGRPPYNQEYYDELFGTAN